MQIILLVAGLILLLAVSAPWAATAGAICLAVFAGITLFQILVIVSVRRKMREMEELHGLSSINRVRSRRLVETRNRRGF